MHSSGDFSLKMSLYHTLHSLWAVYEHFMGIFCTKEHHSHSLLSSCISLSTPPPLRHLQGHISVADELQECNWSCTLFIFLPFERLLCQTIFLTGMAGLIRIFSFHSTIFNRWNQIIQTKFFTTLPVTKTHNFS